jgi:RNA polymerase sigma factor (sigma-70 family)
MKADLQLLAQYHQRGDALAFRELVHSHSGMVHATARRITQDEALAQDVTQEAFVKLARQSKNITESVAAWLHRVASRLACNAVRDDSTRRKNEEAAAAVAALVEEKESPWSEVEPELDAIIDELPEDTRAPLVMHFLQGRSQRDIAKELKLSQSSVSRAIEAGLTELRKRLRGRGVLCGTGLGALLLAQSASAAPVPAALVATLCKIGMAGIGGNALATAAAAGLSGAALWKLATALLVTAGVVVIGVSAARSRVEPVKSVVAPDDAALPSPVAVHLPVSSPQRLRTSASPRSRALPATDATVSLPVMPVHELVHSFPQTIPRPFGAMVLADGWVWGITMMGGEYGCGTVFKVKPNGSEWQDVIAFKGRSEHPRGQLPRGVILAHDGALWGTTADGGEFNEGTLFRVDRNTGELVTMVEFGPETGKTPGIAVAEAPDGSIWGTTDSSVFRFDPATREFLAIATFTGKGGALPGMIAMGGLATDGNGVHWGTTTRGGRSDAGTVFKVDSTNRTVVSVAQFTGRRGALPGTTPYPAPTPDGRGFVWGVTTYGGSDDSGVIFKVEAATNVCSVVTEFSTHGSRATGTNPEAALAVDGDGNLWGGTRYATAITRGSGNVFKADRTSGQITSMFFFSGKQGSHPGGPLRGPMLLDGAGGFIGACNFGGIADFGTLFRVETRTGSYTMLRDLADLATFKDGSEPRGRLTSGDDGCLWGTAQNSGARHCGTVFKFNPITDSLVTIADFTGNSGSCKGSYPRAGLTSDGHGGLWGVTTGGGINERGTIYKIDERTNTFETVHEFGLPNKRPGPAGTGPETELVDDHRGFLWGTTRTSVFKINIQTHALKVIARFTGERGPLHGIEPEALALDGRGFIWGAAFGEPRRTTPGTIFKIDVVTDALTVIEDMTDARRGTSSITYRQGDMHWDGRASVWFAGAYARDAPYATRTLVKMNAASGKVEAWYRHPDFTGITTPVMDDRGLLWGLSGQGGAHSEGSIYCFDPASQKFSTIMEFSGAGPQAHTGEQPETTRIYRHTDGNLYAGTRYGGPGNGGTIFRLRFGPTPMTQEATMFADGSAELHGTLRPNGRDSEAAFEWGMEPSLNNATTTSAGTVNASESAQSITTSVTGLKPGSTYYFRLRGKNDNNRIAQRGAVLSFTMPVVQLAAASTAEADGAANANSSTATTAASASNKHALNIVRIPGAGAGFVRGGLAGQMYEIGKRYTLTALADNDYIFSRWSGPGITGAQAESRVLNFVFTEDLAQSPVITATFVKNPFQDYVVGSFNGLVLAAEGVQPDVSNTGALRMDVTRSGTFTGELRYDQRRIPLLGTFDIGGLARFGAARLPSLSVPGSEGGPAGELSLQLDLNPNGSTGISGTITLPTGNNAQVHSLIAAERSFYDGRQRTVPAELMADNGRHRLLLTDADGGVHALFTIAPTGNATFAARLRDGTGVLAGAPLSQINRAAFFSQLYSRSQGSFGGAIILPDLLGDDKTLRSQPFWWCQPAPIPWQDTPVRVETSENSR